MSKLNRSNWLGSPPRPPSRHWLFGKQAEGAHIRYPSPRALRSETNPSAFFSATEATPSRRSAASPEPTGLNPSVAGRRLEADWCAVSTYQRPWNLPAAAASPRRRSNGNAAPPAGLRAAPPLPRASSKGCFLPLS